MSWRNMVSVCVGEGGAYVCVCACVCIQNYFTLKLHVATANSAVLCRPSIQVDANFHLSYFLMPFVEAPPVYLM